MQTLKYKLIGICLLLCFILLILGQNKIVRIDIKAQHKREAKTLTLAKNKKDKTVIGYLKIDKLVSETAIVDGVNFTKDLSRGIGRMKEFSEFGENGQTIIGGHRETIFKNMNKVKGNEIVEVFLNKLDNKLFYKITDKEIVDKDTGGRIVYKDVKDRDELLIVVCYPIDGKEYNPKKRIVFRCERVDNVKLN